MSVREEICKIPNLKNVGLALIDYIESLCLGVTFELKTKRWVPSVNFVTFTVQHARSKNRVISLRGNEKEFLEFKELSLREGMGYGAYTECTLENSGQLPAISMHIRKAYELYNEGGTRDKKHPKITDE